MEDSKFEFSNDNIFSRNFWKKTFFKENMFRTFDFVASRIIKIRNK